MKMQSRPGELAADLTGAALDAGESDCRIISESVRYPGFSLKILTGKKLFRTGAARIHPFLAF